MKTIICTMACLLSFQTYAASTFYQGSIDPKLDIKISYSVYASSGLKSCYAKALGIFAVNPKKEVLHFEVDMKQNNTFEATLDVDKFEALTNGDCQYRIYDQSAVISDGKSTSKVYLVGSSPIDCTYVDKNLSCRQRNIEHDTGQLNITLK